MKIATSSSKLCWILTSVTGFTQLSRTSRFSYSFFVDSSFWERREEISLVLTKTTIQLLALALLPRPDEFTLCLFVLIAHSQRILQNTTQQPSSSSPPSSPRRFFAIWKATKAIHSFSFALFPTHSQSLNVWTGTWNMGECEPPYNIEEWIPHFFDLIAVGVEECMRIPPALFLQFRPPWARNPN